jgi:nitroreductase
VVTSKLSESKLTQQEDYASVCCAIQNFSLYLTEAGLASKWSTGAITRDNRFYELLNINTKSEIIVGLIWYGYPKQLPTQSRGKLDDILTVID